MSHANIYIGLMSGTSVDAIDAVAVRFPEQQGVELIATHSHNIPASIQQQIIELNHVSENELHHAMTLDLTLGELFAEATQQLLHTAQLSAQEIVAIGSHGQTIRHQMKSEPRYSLQIGNPHLIAERTGITTVADFRMRDIVTGGQGAPLVPAFHKAIFSSTKTARIILNIGGMSNLTFLGTNGSITGFDTGPGNVLMDYWFKKHQNGHFDQNGQWAAQGQVNSSLLQHFLNEAFFSHPPPKSTGRELFDSHWLEQKLRNTESTPRDIQASLLQLTVESIAQAIEQWGTKSREIFVCGGGANNTYLMQQLALRLKNIEVNSTAILGIHPDWVEACAFAWFAKQTIEKQPGNIPSVTGAHKESILGTITQV